VLLRERHRYRTEARQASEIGLREGEREYFMNTKEHFMKQRKSARASERHVRFVVSLKRNQQTPKVETSGATASQMVEWWAPAGPLAFGGCWWRRVCMFITVGPMKKL